MLLSGLCRRCTSIVSIPKQWRYKDVNPSSTPLSLRSRSFFPVLIKTLDHNLGQGSSQLIWLCILFQENHSVHLPTKVSITSVHPHTSKKCWKCQSKANDGSPIVKQGSQYLSKRKNEKKHIYNEKPAKSKNQKDDLGKKSRHPADCNLKIDRSGKSRDIKKMKKRE